LETPLILPDHPSGNPPESAPRRGISPTTLLEQVENTIPFIFEPSYRFDAEKMPHVALLRRLHETRNSSELGHVDYFELCLAAHHASVASFVPTDVDNQIRFKLWSPQLSTEDLAAMAKKVITSLNWDYHPLSTRFVRSPKTGESISGHEGEWFSTAAGAYGALRKRDPDTASEIARRILAEVERQATIFKDLREARDGIGALKAATLIAHNLGDLDRVIDMWFISARDPLKQAVFKLGHPPDESPAESQPREGVSAWVQKLLLQAAALNKLCMADENHRHFALRQARPLRRHPDFLLPIGPFFDDWGLKIGRHPQIQAQEVADVVEALVIGWEKLNKPGATTGKTPVGYSRALAGILETFPGGFAELSRYIPARTERILKAGELRAQISVARARFENQWSMLGMSKV
jgi:hypothetical protein